MIARNTVTACACVLITSLLFPAPAYAGKVMFGTQDTIEKIQDTKITGPKGEKLYLAHKFAIHSFVAPYMLSDDGYVLGVEGDTSRYFALEASMLADFQQRGLLPKPLPPYEIATFHYIFGYLLWEILAGLGLWGLYENWKQTKEKAAIPFVVAAVAHSAAGRLEPAIDDYTKALAIAPSNAAIALARAGVHAQLNQYDQAIADYSSVLKKDKKHGEALLLRAMAFSEQKKFGPAAADFTRALKNEKHPLVYAMRGTAYRELGDTKKALADLNAAIKLAPEYTYAFEQRALTHTQSGDYANADADRSKAAALKAAQSQQQGPA